MPCSPVLSSSSEPPPPYPGSDVADNVLPSDGGVDENDKGHHDLLEKIPSMYRLLNLLYETGSGGQGGLGMPPPPFSVAPISSYTTVEKIVIDQKSLGSLLNRMSPGSYRSISSIDFKALDKVWEHDSTAVFAPNACSNSSRSNLLECTVVGQKLQSSCKASR